MSYNIMSTLGKFHFTNASLYKVWKSALGLLKSVVDKQICIVSAYGLSSNNKSLPLTNMLS